MTTYDGPTDVVRITLTNADGTVQEIEVDDDLHYILGFVKVRTSWREERPRRDPREGLDRHRRRDSSSGSAISITNCSTIARGG